MVSVGIRRVAPTEDEASLRGGVQARVRLSTCGWRMVRRPRRPEAFHKKLEWGGEGKRPHAFGLVSVKRLENEVDKRRKESDVFTSYSWSREAFFGYSYLSSGRKVLISLIRILNEHSYTMDPAFEFLTPETTQEVPNQRGPLVLRWSRQR